MAGFRRRAFAEACELHRTHVSLLERGRINITVNCAADRTRSGDQPVGAIPRVELSWRPAVQAPGGYQHHLPGIGRCGVASADGNGDRGSRAEPHELLEARYAFRKLIDPLESMVKRTGGKGP